MTILQPILKLRWGLALILALGVMLLMQPLTVWAGTIIVNTAVDEADGSCSDGDCSLRDALALAADGDTIVFAGDMTIVLSSQLEISNTVTIDGGGRSVTISGNDATRLFHIQATGVVTLSRLSLSSGRVGSGQSGGGIYNNGGAVTLLSSTLSDNRAVVNGGGIYNLNGTLTIRNSTLSANGANPGFPPNIWGAGIFNSGGVVWVTHSTLSGNQASNSGAGGGIYNGSGSVTVQYSTFSGNSGGGGGGIYNDATLTVTHSTFSGNWVGGPNGGGGLYNAGAALVQNCTFSGNSAGNPSMAGKGGGICNAGTLTATNSTLSGNRADDGYGGGLYNGGALYLYNTAAANSPKGSDCRNGGAMAANDHNLIEDNTCSPFLSGDPALGALANNGGPTQTFLPGSSSPVINQGNPAACLALDQRGYGRPDTCDIGAVEVNALTPDMAVLGGGLVITDGDTTPASADGTEFGSLALGQSLTHTFTLSNSGQAPLSVSNFSVSGAAAADFSVSSLNLPALVPPAASVTFQVTFAPTAGGARAATLVIANNDPDEAPYNFALQGTCLTPDMAVLGGGLIIADGDATPASADGTDFGSLVGAAALTHTFTISNSGVVTLTVSSVSLSGAGAGDFSVSGLSFPAQIPAAAAVTFQVRFAPTAPGVRAATLSLANNDFDEAPYDFALQGTAPCLFLATVQNTNDSGVGSLRQKLLEVCAGGAVEFAAGLAGQTIVLTSAELSLTRTVAIANPHAPGLALSGNNARRIFNIQAGSVVTLSQLTLRNGKVTGGSSCPAYCGSGILNAGTLTVRDSTLSGNVAGFWGGGIYNTGALSVQASTFSGNAAGLAGAGGGIYNDGTLTVSNSTFSGNSGGYNGGGGGIYNDGTLSIQHSTFSANTAAGGGGLFNTTGRALSLRNSVFANSPRGGDCYNEGDLVVNDHNLVEDGGCEAALSGDPALGALANNGGETSTFALLLVSKAIDAGGAGSCFAADQRGFARADLRCDIGAFERQFSDGDTVIKTGMTSGVQASFGPTFISMTVTSGNAGTVTATKHLAYPGGSQDAGEVPATWTLTAGGSPFAATLALCYTDAEITGLNESRLRAFRWDTGALTWTVPISTGLTVDAAHNCVRLTGVSAFSAWTLKDVSVGAAKPTAVHVAALAGWGLAPFAALLALGGMAALIRKRR